MHDDLQLYRTMLLIRRFEERLLDEFSAGRLVGTTHAYIGQEADAAGIFSELSSDDVIFSHARCPGHFLAYGGDPYPLEAELMGRATGLVGGRGGSVTGSTSEAQLIKRPAIQPRTNEIIR